LPRPDRRGGCPGKLRNPGRPGYSRPDHQDDDHSGTVWPQRYRGGYRGTFSQPVERAPGCGPCHPAPGQSLLPPVAPWRAQGTLENNGADYRTAYRTGSSRYSAHIEASLAWIIRRAVKRCSALAGAGPAWGNCRFAPVATETAGRVTDLSKLSGHRSTMGGSASRRVATRVKPEQASKGKS